jgi:gliding motility-associated-like protein
MKKILLILTSLVFCSLAIAQPSNNNCANALEICTDKTRTGTTVGANSQVCATCADGPAVIGSACFPMVKTVWYQFTTNATGGNASIDISAINCSTGTNGISGIVYQATTPCNAATYTAVSNCVVNSTGNFSLNAAGLIANTTYYILISSDSVNACSFDITVSGAAVALPPSSIVISSNAGATTVCPEDDVVFTYTTTNCSNPLVNWYVNGGYERTTSGGSPFVRNYFLNGDIVRGELVCDCGQNTLSNDVTVSVHPYITIDAGPYTNIPFGGSTQLKGTGGITYSWSPTETLDNPNISNPIATPLGATTYTLTATSIEGCRFFAEVIVNVLDSIFVPNTFTPNGDGVNDTWEILLIDFFPKAEITVFDRWGQIVYKTIGYPASRRWDGTRNGNQLPATTYYYTISLSIDSKEERLKTGSITIIY